MHTLDQCDGLGKRYLLRPWTVLVTAHRPRAFVVIRMSRQAFGQVYLSPIEKLSFGCDSHENRGITVFGGTDRCSLS